MVGIAMVGGLLRISCPIVTDATALLVQAEDDKENAVSGLKAKAAEEAASHKSALEAANAAAAATTAKLKARYIYAGWLPHWHRSL